MKVILTDELRGKGGEGDIVEVAQGYAENFLFPNKMGHVQGVCSRKLINGYGGYCLSF